MRIASPSYLNWLLAIWRVAQADHQAFTPHLRGGGLQLKPPEHFCANLPIHNPE